MNRIKKMTYWITRQVKAAGAKGIVLGLSGGIDSAVVALLCKKALGKNRVLGLLMPCESNADDERCAIRFAGKTGIRTKKIALDSVFKQFLKVVGSKSKMAKANLKPRLRMCALYMFSHSMNYLVAGTGNKSECAVGYFTKYGDGGVDILPLAGLLKTEVRDLAKKLRVPQAIIDRPPSAGLWNNQTDEAEMGITYEDLDKIISAIEKNKTKGIDRKKLMLVKKMMRVSEHKRKVIPAFKG